MVSSTMGSQPDLPSCIGRYCGFQPDATTMDQWDLSKCGACPRGFRTNQTKFCVKCEDPLDVYEWQFLCFMVALPCMINWIFILRHRTGGKLLATQILLSIAECACATIFALLSTEPMGSLSMISCGVQRLSDWYPMFYNPQLQYTQTVHCTQEVVYPLLTTVCIYYAYLLSVMLLFRPIALSLIGPSKQWQDPIYAALYSLPILVVAQAVFGGLVYYAFPYIAIFVSLIAMSIYFVWTEIFTLSSLKRNIARNILIILWHIAVIGFGIISLQSNLYYLVLVVVPVLFYFMTIKFTDPSSIDKELTYTGM